MRTRIVTAALLCGAAFLGACGGTAPGTPTVAGGGASGATTSAAEPSSGSTDRPAAIDLAGKDPCAVLEPQVPSWGDTSEPRRDTMGGGSVLDGSPTCIYLLREQDAAVSLLTTADVGLPEYLDSSQQVSTADVEVDGFPAAEQEGVTSSPETGSGECYVHVDVADGQMMSVQFSQLAASADKRLPIEMLCAKAREVASAAVTTLQGG